MSPQDYGNARAEPFAGYRLLPRYLMEMLSPEDYHLNTLPAEQLIQLFAQRKVLIFVDRSRAMQAVALGFPTSKLATLLSFAGPVLLAASPFVWFLHSWSYALGTLIGAIVALRSTRALAVASVRDHAMRDPELLDALVASGVIWFETLELHR